MESISRLLRYKAWANSCLYRSLEGVPAARLKAKQAIVFGSIIRTLHHNYAMDVVWQAHLSGTSHSYSTRNPEACPAFEELRARQESLDAWYCDYGAGLSAALAPQVLEFDFIGGGRGRMTREEVLLHVVNHATYHRGHVADMMYNEGLSPPTTDLPVFLRTLT